MNSGKFVWGAIITLVGLLLLGTNFGLIDHISWSRVADLWPLFIVAFGLRLLIKHDGTYGALILLLVVAAVAYGYSDIKVAPKNQGPFNTFIPEKFIDNDDESGVLDKTISAQDIKQLHLDIDGFYKVSVRGDAVSDISIKAEGPARYVDRLTVEQKGKVVSLTSKQDTSFNWYITKQETAVTIVVPQSLALDLDLSGAVDTAIIGHQGDVGGQVSGSAKVSLTESITKNLAIDVSGASKAIFDTAEGTADITVSGASSLDIITAAITTAQLEASGASSISIKSGTIGSATSEASGASKITMPKATNTNSVDESGAGSVNFN